MNPKQKVKSLKAKLKRLQDRNPNINLSEASQYFFDIERYYKIRQELFFLEFELNHCPACGKKYDTINRK